MIVFKTYFKIVKTYLPTLLIYTTIFLVFAFLFTKGDTANVSSFEASKPKINIINEDTNSPLIETLIKYLEKHSKIIELDKNLSKEDALFFRHVNYILIIPEGFTEDFITGNNIKLDRKSVADSTDAYYSEILINNFLTIAQLYVDSNLDEEVIANNILNDLEKQTNVKIVSSGKDSQYLERICYFFNFTNYMFLAFLIIVIGLIMDSFKKGEIHKRNSASAISIKRLNGELMLSNFVISVLIWLMFMLLSIGLYGTTMFTSNGLLLMLNSFVFILFALSISFLVGSFIKGEEAISACSNIIALGSSFICGAFVPQELLGPTILNASKIFPSYWFIKNNHLIVKLDSFNFTSLKPILINMGIVLVGALLVYILTNIIFRLRLKKY